MEGLLHALELTLATGKAPTESAIAACLEQLPKEKHETFRKRYQKLLKEYLG